MERIHIFAPAALVRDGRGPPHMAVGDIVCVVKGCGMPVLLRDPAEAVSAVCEGGRCAGATYRHVGLLRRGLDER